MRHAVRRVVTFGSYGSLLGTILLIALKHALGGTQEALRHASDRPGQERTAAAGACDAGGAQSEAMPIAVPALPRAPNSDSAVALRLELNIPAYRLDVVEAGSVTRSYRVAVGHPKYRTPTGSYRITYIIWNPAWVPPPSEWAKNETRKPPGPVNPMGRVKLNVHGFVFIHGTPLEGSLSTAASHACVRMANADAIEIARLVHGHASPDVTLVSLDSLVADSTRTYRIVLRHPVPVRVGYVLAEVRDGTLALYPDIYKRGNAGRVTAATAALRGTGIDAARIDLARLRAFAKRARRSAVTVPIDSVLTGRPMLIPRPSAARATR